MGRRKYPPPPANLHFRTRYIRGGMDMRFIIKNWRAINETPIKKAGLLIRTIMRGSIRRAYRSKKTGYLTQKPSKPGSPPRARYGMPTYQDPSKPKPKKPKGLPFKKILSIPFDNGSKAVIGHALLPIKKQDPTKTPMQVHEFGGRIKIKTTSMSKFNKFSSRMRHKKTMTQKQKKAARRLYLQGRLKHKVEAKRMTKTIRMPKRPFASPALTKARSRIGQFWAGRINKGTVRNVKNFRI